MVRLQQGYRMPENGPEKLKELLGMRTERETR